MRIETAIKMKPRKRKVQPWEPEIYSWFKRHETQPITPELRELFITFLFKKKAAWDIALIKEVLAAKK